MFYSYSKCRYDECHNTECCSAARLIVVVGDDRQKVQRRQQLVTSALVAGMRHIANLK